MHFTDKLRNGESSLDYSGTRYYTSTLGRFTIPDFSDGADAIPYADLSDPQSLNLYAYAGNNALGNSAPEGHKPCTIYTIMFSIMRASSSMLPRRKPTYGPKLARFHPSPRSSPKERPNCRPPTIASRRHAVCCRVSRRRSRRLPPMVVCRWFLLATAGPAFTLWRVRLAERAQGRQHAAELAFCA